MPKLSKGHKSGNIVYKVAFPITVFIRGKFYNGGKMCYFPGANLPPENIIFPGGGGNFSSGKL